MFDFSLLKIDKRDGSSDLSSFVGIRRNAINDELEFRLPRGFEHFPSNDFDATKKLFFRMYRTFKKFEHDRRILELDERALGKDNVERQENSYRFRDKEDNDVVLYSKIALIENLLETYHDLALDVIERRIGQDEKVDYSKIDCYLHKAIYLPNDVIYIDEMDVMRQTIQYGSAILVELFCFIVSELKNELEQEINDRVRELAYRFSEQFLSHDQSLFNEETFEITLQTLKNTLDDVDKFTTYKDNDYWRIFEAIETFLYSELDMDSSHEEGTFWGVSNFSSIWEDMCSTYAFANFDVYYADTNIIFNGQRVSNAKSAGFFPVFKRSDFIDPFYIEFRGQKRWLRPDLVWGKAQVFCSDVVKIVTENTNGLTVNFVVKPIDNSKEAKERVDLFCSNLKTVVSKKHLSGVRPIGKDKFKNFPKNELDIQKNKPIGKQRVVLLDWKYMDKGNFMYANEKVHTDITKQLCYEFALQNSKPEASIESQFVIPWYYAESNELEEPIGDFMDSATLVQRLQDNNLEVFKANFLVIQAAYLKHD